MSTNWMRHFELQLISDNGEGIVLSDFKVTFLIERNDNRWPATAKVRIYNRSQETQNRIMNREFGRIVLIAGYDGLDKSPSGIVPASTVGVVREIDSTYEAAGSDDSNYGVIFSGDISFSVTGKDNITDSWVSIVACDGEKAFREATINGCLEKGYTLRDEYNMLMKCLEPYGISKGIEPEFPDTVYPRGMSYMGRVADYLSGLAKDLRATWQFSYGKVDFIQEGVAKHEAYRLNADTGLIGKPQQTIGAGVNVTCLINSKIQLHGLIELDQASIYRADLSAEQVNQSGGVTTQDINGNIVTTGLVQKEQPASIATDGVYIVRYISYRGDTRGQNWYMDMACEARGAADVYSSSFLQKVPS